MGLISPLTTGIDTFAGGKGDDTFTSTVASGMSAFDAFDGGAGAGDTLTVTQDGALDTTAVGSLSIKNMENVTLRSNNGVTTNSTDWGTTSLTVSNGSTGGAVVVTAESTTAVSATNAATAAVTVSGGLSQTISGVGGAVTASGSTGAITVTQTKAAAAAVLVNGGTTVSVTQTGKTAAGSTLTVGNTSAPTGAVTVTTSSDSTAATFTTGAISVKGGSSVAITSNLLGTAATATITSGTIGVTGTANTTTVSVTQTKAATAAAGVTGVVNGAVTIADVNAGTSTADKITTVTLANYGNSTIDSAALNSLTISGGGGTLGVNRTTSDTTANATTLALNVGGGSFGAITGTHLVDFTTVNLATSSAATTLADLQATGATAVNISGNQNLKTTAQGFAAAAVITSTSTGNVTLGTALAVGQKYTGGDGVDTLTLAGAQTKANSTGAGDDVITYGGAFAAGGSFDAGTGTDTIVMTAAQAVTATADSTFAGTVSNFEKLTIGALGAATAIDLANADGINYVTLNGASGANALTISNMLSGGTFRQVGTTPAITNASSIAVKDAATGTADVVNLVLIEDTGAGITNTAALTIANVETINITSTDGDATGGNTVNTPFITAAGATTITVTGDTGVDFTGSTLGAVTSFNASGVTFGSVTTNDGASTAVTTAAAMFATTGVTITGGEGNDVLIGNSATGKIDTITGGVGDDTVTGGAGNDVLTGGAGADTITGGAGNDTINGDDGDDTINGGAGNDTINGGAGVDAITIGAGANTVDVGTGTTNSVATSAAMAGLNVITFGSGIDTFDVNHVSTAAGYYPSIVGIAAGDKIDLAGAGVGTVVAEATLGAAISLGANSSFANYLDSATAGNATAATNAVVNWFQFNNKTYIVLDNSNNNTYTDGVDLVIELAGLVSLTSSTLAAEVITIV